MGPAERPPRSGRQACARGRPARAAVGTPCPFETPPHRASEVRSITASPRGITNQRTDVASSNLLGSGDLSRLGARRNILLRLYATVHTCTLADLRTGPTPGPRRGDDLAPTPSRSRAVAPRPGDRDLAQP